MARQKTALLAFNRGLVSRLGLARIDLKRVAMSAEVYTNFMPRVLGSMMLRPGLQHLGSTADNNTAYFLPFVFSIADKALLELTDFLLRVWIDGALVTRPAVTTTITNGTFLTDLTGWTDADEGSAASTWATGGYMQLVGTGTQAAYRYQSVNPGANANIQHALHVVIERGPVIFRVGSTSAGDDYVSETTLDTGVHSLAFTPTGTFYVQFLSRLQRITLVDECVIEAAGVMEVEAPWAEADLDSVRADQSGDVVFVACDGYQQWKIERRAEESWSVALYQPEDGPFRIANVGPITMTASVLSGNGTLTASAPYFKSTHVGALFALTSTGQTVTLVASALNDATDEIVVDGVGTDRAFTIVLSGGFAGGRTVILQRSFDNSTWVAVSGKSWTADTTESYNDGLDNEIVYYRLLLSVVGSAGNTTMTLQIATGTNRGIGRVTAYTSSTLVSVEVLDSFGSTSATDDWEEGEWSDRRGFPTSVALYESRLVWAGRDRAIASASDDFYGYDLTAEGDSAALSRTIGSGPVDNITWLMPLQRLLMGGQGAEFSLRSTSFDEPLTPTNANIKKASTQGSARVQGVPIDARGVFVQRGGTRVYELAVDGESLDYNSNHLTALVPTIGAPGIVRIGVQRQPDTRVHCVRSDGTACVMVYDRIENVICWVEITSPGATGLIEDVVILPGDEGSEEDEVYYVVKRTINATTKRFLEKWALESECVGGTLNKQVDCFEVFTNSPASATVTGLTHLVGATVVVWADGLCLKDADGDIQTFVVNGSGEITLTNEGEQYVATTGVVGPAYTAQWQSAKLAQVATELGVPLNDHKGIKGMGLILADYHPQGLRFGRDFTNMDDLPQVVEGSRVDLDDVEAALETDIIVFPGDWETDARVCLEANAPRPVTVLAAIATVTVHA